MERLSEKEWKQFGFAEVFDIKKGFYNKKPEDDGTGTIPFLGATDPNNGVTRFLTLEEIKHGTKTGDLHNSPLEKKLFPGHAIAVTNNGSVGHAFYQATKFTCSHDINPLYLRDHEMSREEADFLIKAIEEQGILFQYARKWRPICMVKSKIMLPIDDKEDPDYAYMTLYSAEVGGGMLMRYKNFIAGQLSQLEHKAIPALDEKKWKPVLISSMFGLVRGRENNMAVLEDGDTPLISAKANNNGLKGFVHNPKKIITGQCITLNNDGDGGAGLAYYQPANMALDSHVTALVPLFDMSAFAMLFIAKCISGLHGFFGHGLSISNSRAKRLRIMLPVTDVGEPDYEYMEQYAKNMMLRKYEQYLAFIDRQSSAEEVSS